MIFLGWNDSDHKGACVLEEASTASDMQFRVRLSASLKSSGFIVVRSDDFKNDVSYTPAKKTSTDTTGSTGSTGSNTSTGSSGSNTNTGDSTPATRPRRPDDPTCTPKDAASACKDAYDTAASSAARSRTAAAARSIATRSMAAATRPRPARRLARKQVRRDGLRTEDGALPAPRRRPRATSSAEPSPTAAPAP